MDEQLKHIENVEYLEQISEKIFNEKSGFYVDELLVSPVIR